MKTYYDMFAEKVPDPRLLFMNYGYAESAEHRYRWIKPQDRWLKYHLSLAHRAMTGIQTEGKRVLEIGSGRGGNCYYLSNYTQARKIYGIDICEGSVRLCKQNKTLGDVTFLKADAGALPFRNGAFDVVFNLESSHLYPKFETFISEVHRVLKPGGMFAYGDLWFLDSIPIDWKKRERSLRAPRFVITREEDVTEGVFQALKKEDGLNSILQSMKARGNKKLLDRLIRANDGMRLSLAFAKCSYWIYNLRRT
jgi:O-methyltransferase